MDFNIGAKITKSIGITQDNMDMITDADIGNLSSFINELIFDALNDNNNMKRILMKKITSLQFEASKLGYMLNVDLKDIDPTAVKTK